MGLPDFYANGTRAWRELTPKFKQKQTKATKSETRHLVFYILKNVKERDVHHVFTRFTRPARGILAEVGKRL
jgi:hypothetical protein